MKNRNQTGLGLWGMGLAWATTVLTGMAIVIGYGTGPGDAGTPPAVWPEESSVHVNAARPHLLMFVHPHCPCTRASLGELAHILAQCKGKLDARVLFFDPEGHDERWVETDLWRSAERLPGVTVARDAEGEEARRFGAVTSGHTLLFDEDGRLVFSGGITESRGHAGDNVGRSAVVSHLTGKPSLVPGATGLDRCAVYGCALLEEDSI